MFNPCTFSPLSNSCEPKCQKSNFSRYFPIDNQNIKLVLHFNFPDCAFLFPYGTREIFVKSQIYTEVNTKKKLIKYSYSLYSPSLLLSPLSTNIYNWKKEKAKECKEEKIKKLRKGQIIMTLYTYAHPCRRVHDCMCTNAHTHTNK